MGRQGRWTSFAVALAAAAGVAVMTAGAGAATKPSARGETDAGAQALQASALAPQAALAALDTASGVSNRGKMRRAQTRPTLQALSTTAGVKRYLRSIGVNPAGIVIQRGRLNYAGPTCPGKAWTCTNAHKVVQIASRAASAGTGRTVADRGNEPPGLNRVDCPPDTTFDTGPGLPPGTICVILQVAQPGANNDATCIIETTTPAAAQGCSIVQVNADGKNRAVVREVARQTAVSTPPFGGAFDQIALQTASVEQYNQRGDNDAQLTQRIDQRINEERQATSPQHASGAGQSMRLYQQGDSANRAGIEQTYDQNIHNLARDVSDLELGIQGMTVNQCGTSSGFCVLGPADQTVHMSQTFSQALDAPQAISGFQGQSAQPFESQCRVEDQTGAPPTCGTVNQISGGVSRAFVKQKGLQRASAPKTSRVSQRQDDPFSCCTGDPQAQLANPNNHFELDQDRTQLANSSIYVQLADVMEGSCLTSGRCAVRQRANQNGDVTLNSCDRPDCDIRIVCPPGGAPCVAVPGTTPGMLARRRG